MITLTQHRIQLAAHVFNTFAARGNQFIPSEHTKPEMTEHETRLYEAAIDLLRDIVIGAAGLEQEKVAPATGDAAAHGNEQLDGLLRAAKQLGSNP